MFNLHNWILSGVAELIDLIYLAEQIFFGENDFEVFLQTQIGTTRLVGRANNHFHGFSFSLANFLNRTPLLDHNNRIFRSTETVFSDSTLNPQFFSFKSGQSDFT